MQTIALNQSVATIPDGASLMIGGFMGVGSPERIMAYAFVLGLILILVAISTADA